MYALLTPSGGGVGVTTRVLLIDDLPDTLQRIRAALTRPGQIEFVGDLVDGPTAVASAGEWQPDVVVIDTDMPRLGDGNVLAQLRADAPDAMLVVFPARSADLSLDQERYGEAGGRWGYLSELLLSPGRREGPHAAVHLEPTPASAGVARQFTRETLATWCGGPDAPCDEDAADDVVLVVSELVSNAIRHEHSGCDLRLVLSDSVIRVECGDDGEGTPALLPRSTTRAFGRGLDLIDSLTAAWGVEPAEEPGKVVWAEVPRHKSEPAD